MEDEKKIVLPVKYPTITSWPWTAAIFSVLEGNGKYEDWLYENFTQLFCEEYDKWVSVHYLPHFDVFSVCPLIKSALIPREFISTISINIIELMKMCIRLNYYICCEVDEQYISKNKKFVHELFIYGFDDEEGKFYVADFTLRDDQKYSFLKVSYENMKLAYEAVTTEDDDMKDGSGARGGILIFKVKENADYNFLVDRLIKPLEDYVKGEDRGKDYRMFYVDEELGLKETVYGIAIYKYIENYYAKIRKNRDDKHFYIQPLHVLYDHKVLMCKKLEIIKKSGIEISQNVIQQFNELKQEAFIIRNLGIKYWICKKEYILDRIVRRLHLMEEKDKSACENLLREIKIGRRNENAM